MSFSTKFYVFIKIAALVLCGYFVFSLQIKAAAITKQEVLQIEEKARQLGTIWQEDSVKQAIELFQKSAEHWETLGDLEKSAECLRQAAKLKLMLAEEKSALLLLNKSLKLEQIKKNSVGETDTLSLLTIVSTRLNENDKSNIYRQKALELAEQIQKSPQRALALTASATYYYGQRDFQTWLKELEKSLKLYQEIGDKKSEAETLIEMAYGYIINNDRIRGRDTALQAIEISKNSGNLRTQTLALIALGDAYQRMGESEAALKTLMEAKTLFTPELDFFDKAVLYNRLGHYFRSFNNLDEAKKHFQKSFQLFERANNPEGRSELLTVLGQICVQQNNLNEALQYFNQARQIALDANDQMPLATVNLRLGEVNLYLKKYAEAEKNLQDSLSYFEKIGLQYRVAEVQEQLGLIYENQKNYSEAGKKYSAALELNRKVLSRFAQAQTLFNLARLDRSQNRFDSALDKLTESIQLTESSNNETANSKLRQTYFSNVYDRYELYISLLMNKHKQSPNENYAIQALQASERARSRSLLETLQLSNANFTKDANPELVKREKEILNLLNLKADKLTELLSKDAEKAETDKIEEEIRTLEHELEDIKAKFKQDSPIYSAVKNPAPFDVAEFQQNILDDRTLLLEFALSENESYLWLIGKTEVCYFILPARNILENRIEKIRQAFEKRQKSPDEAIEVYQKRILDLEEIFNREAKQLSNELLGQVADKIADKRLIIVPDGKLHYLPLTALPFPNSNEPLIFHNEIVYEPSASLLNLIAKIQKGRKSSKKDLLIFADPVFSDDDNRLTQKAEAKNNFSTFLGLSLREIRLIDANGKIPRLFATQEEADLIADVVGKSRTEIVSGFSANRERALNSNISDYRILHFATHGLVDVERPEVSSIVLSQFDEAGNKREGFLRLQDIYSLNLASDLVVLSACQSGIGKEVKGEGLMSINNAFLQVGAKSVLSSAWKVDDYATTELMKNFYQGLIEKKLPPSEALRQAQMKMSQNSQFSSPFYWAAFTVQGEFRQPVSVGNTNYFYYFGWVILAILGLITGFKVFRRFENKSRQTSS